MLEKRLRDPWVGSAGRSVDYLEGNFVPDLDKEFFDEPRGFGVY